MRTKLITTLKRRATALQARIDGCQFLEKHMTIVEGIARGEKAAAEGRVLFHADARKRLAKWLK